MFSRIGDYKKCKFQSASQVLNGSVGTLAMAKSSNILNHFLISNL